jgi:DNA mismatch repair protein MutS
MNDDVTPIRQQYLDIKQKYPDTILFFRLGDFYETFDDDAETASRELDIVLTSRNVAKGMRIPMAGIPYHAVDNYLSRLIDKGFHVAICEQMGDQPSKGLFPREVVRVVTPGTVVEPTLLRSDQNNFLAAVTRQEDTAAVAYVDITTGDFFTTQFPISDQLSELRTELIRLNPAEVLAPETFDLSNVFSGHITRLPDWHFETGRCRESLLRQFEVQTLDGFGLKESPLATQAAGVILQYLKETQPASLPLLDHVSTYSISEFMSLDASTRRNLELTETIRNGETQGSLLSILDQTITPMGHRLIRQWVSKPLLDIPVINARQDIVGYFLKEGMNRAELRASLKSISDLERILNRISTGIAAPRDMVALRSNLENLPEIKHLLKKDENVLQNLIAQFALCPEMLDLVTRAIADDPPATLQNTGVIRTGYSAELDNIIEMSRHAREWISNLENVERERTGIKNLKVGYNKVFGYFIEITNSNTGQAPAEYIRKQTLVNAERYITPEMKEYESLVLNAEERIHEIENRLFKELCREISHSSNELLKTARIIGELDVYLSFAEVATLSGYSRPQLVADPILEIHDGRHPVVETTLHGERFVPNDTIFEPGEIVRTITGPNMSGKSTFLRQVALIVLMAQIGSFVPAANARIGLVDRIFTRIGAQDEIHAGQSTFMVEMIETANILNHATPRSLLILDEIGRGTSTYDGLSIAWAVVEYIHNHPSLKARTLFALPGVRNYNVAVTESNNQVVFLHRIVPGGADRSYGIHVAQLAGIPRSVILRASEILKQLESTSGTAVQIDPSTSQQMTLFPETNPILDELKKIDVNALPPIQAINILYEWQRKFLPPSDREQK